VYQRATQQAAVVPPTTPAAGPASDLAAPGAAPPDMPAAVAASAQPAPPAPWDPGAIPDDALAQVVPRTVAARARRLFDEGQVLDLTRGAKPVAHAHTLSCPVRFLVPGDARYTHCD